jgi:hypothetical protein
MSWPEQLGGDPYLPPGVSQEDIDRHYGEYEPEPEEEPLDPEEAEEYDQNLAHELGELPLADWELERPVF